MTEDGTTEHPVADDESAASEQGTMRPDERELLSAFDRLRPQGSLRWGFEDAMRRVANPDTVLVAGAAPWTGLPADLWERGRSARIGQRFVGDVAGVLAEILATDARATADAAVATANVAAWDALRYLAARVELLEARVDPVGFEIVEQSLPPPDVSEWVDAVGAWLGPPDPLADVIVGESGGGELLRALGGAGHRVQGTEPRGPYAWRSFAGSDEDGPPSAAIVLGEVLDHLRTLADRTAAGVVLAGCVDRLDLAGKIGLIDQAMRITKVDGVIVVLTLDQSAWDEALSIPARDLAPGRPLHPRTWELLLHRAGMVDVLWHRPTSGAVHALVATVKA